MNVTEALIADIVHRVMEAGDFLQGDQPFKKERDPSGITHIQVSTVKCEPFEGREDVRLKDVMTLEEAPRMGAGVMEVDHTDFEWTLS